MSLTTDEAFERVAVDLGYNLSRTGKGEYFFPATRKAFKLFLAGAAFKVQAPDRFVEANRAALLERSVVGTKKYGVTLERPDLTTEQWVEHAIEEALDLANYLQVIKTRLHRAG